MNGLLFIALGFAGFGVLVGLALLIGSRFPFVPHDERPDA